MPRYDPDVIAALAEGRLDPEEDMIAIMMAQLHPAQGIDLNSKFRVLSYQSIVGD